MILSFSSSSSSTIVSKKFDNWVFTSTLLPMTRHGKIQKIPKIAFHRAATWRQTYVPFEAQSVLVNVTLKTSALTF